MGPRGAPVRVAVLVSREPVWALGVARAWAEAGDTVTAVLLDRAAALARAGHADAAAVVAAQQAGVAVGAHDDALRRRGLDATRLAEGVKTITLDEVADLVTENTDKAIWL